MDLAPGEITQQALADQIRINAAIEKDLIDIATRRVCTPYMMPAVYQTSANK
jgi:hypothetical protein